MAVSSYPFEGQPTTEAQYSRLFRELRGTGIAASADSDDMLVTAEPGDLSVRIKPGFAIVRGHAIDNDADVVLAVSAPPFSASRTDRVVLRLDPAADSIDIVVLEGAAGQPAPEPTQTDTGVFELPLATVTVTDGFAMTIDADERVFCGQDNGAWTTARRPASPRLGMAGFNITLNRWEFYDGAAWSSTYPQSAAEEMTAAERDALTGAGLFVGRIIFNTDAGVVEVCDGTDWVAVGPPVAPIIETFTASGTWTKPPGARTVTVICVGAGAGGGNGANTTGGVGAAGGGAVAATVDASALPATVTVTVGAGGTGAAASTSNNYGLAGGASAFGRYATASGGGSTNLAGYNDVQRIVGGDQGWNAWLVSNLTQPVIGAAGLGFGGGNGSNSEYTPGGSAKLAGGGGGQGYRGINTPPGGVGGSGGAYGGNGGNGGAAASSAGQPGAVPGGGGGGGAGKGATGSGGKGGDGARGQVTVITYF